MIVVENYKGFSIDLEPDVSGFRYKIKKLDGFFQASGKADNAKRDNALSHVKRVVDLLRCFKGAI